MKYYFDTSSLVKIYHPEDGSKEALACYLSDTAILISDLSRIEFFSTIHRKYREGEISADALDALMERFQEDLSARYEVLEFSALVLEEATRLLFRFGKRHSLKTLDCLQLAFFLIYADREDVFVCSNPALVAVAQREGVATRVSEGRLREREGPFVKKDGASPRLFLSPPHMGGDEIRFVREAFESNYIAPLGPMVDAFEREFAQYTGIKRCLALSSGTAAMHLALRCLGVGPGDEVFVSTIAFQGAVPVFIDCDRESWNMDPDLLEEELERCARAGRRAAPARLMGSPV